MYDGISILHSPFLVMKFPASKPQFDIAISLSVVILYNSYKHKNIEFNLANDNFMIEVFIANQKFALWLI